LFFGRLELPEFAPEQEVVRALRFDVDEKQIAIEVLVDPLSIEADEQMLRQAVFNLVLNAIQAANPKGEIKIQARKQSSSEAFLEISDNGPGVALEHRGEMLLRHYGHDSAPVGSPLDQAHGAELAERLAHRRT